MVMASFASTGAQINVTADEAMLRIIQRIPGAKRVKAQRDTWTVPFSIDTCAELRNMGAVMDASLSEAVERVEKIVSYVEWNKSAAGEVKPLSKVPIEEPYKMYQHQIKAYNITLSLFFLQQYEGGDAR